MGEREELMRAAGYLECPVWCTQDESERDIHTGPVRAFRDVDGNVLQMRAITNWAEFADGDSNSDGIAVRILLTDGTVAAELAFSPLVFGQLRSAAEDTDTEASDHTDVYGQHKWAFPGASDLWEEREGGDEDEDDEPDDEEEDADDDDED